MQHKDNLRLFIVMATTLMLIGCSPPQKTIQGQWNLVSGTQCCKTLYLHPTNSVCNGTAIKHHMRDQDTLIISSQMSTTTSKISTLEHDTLILDQGTKNMCHYSKENS